MNEGKRTVKDHGQPEVGDWRITGGTGILMRVAGVGIFPDDTEWLPASAVVIPDHYAPPPAKFSVGDWVEWVEDNTVLEVTGVKWSESFRCWQLWRSNGRWVSSDDATKVDPPFPSSLSAVGWRPMSELEDGHPEQVWMLYRQGGRHKIIDTFRRHDENEGRVAWAPVIGAPPVPSDWSPA